MHRHTAGSRASAKFLHRPTRSLRRTISLLSTFGAVAGVQLQTSRSIKPRERDLGDLHLFFLVRILTRPTNHPRHAACASNNQSKPVRPHFCGDETLRRATQKTTSRSSRLTPDPVAPSTARSQASFLRDLPRPAQDPTRRAPPGLAHSRQRNAESPTRCADNQANA